MAINSDVSQEVTWQQGILGKGGMESGQTHQGDFPPACVLDWDGDQLGTAGKRARKRDEEHPALPSLSF